MFDEFVRFCNVVQLEAFGNGKARPPRLQGAVDRAASFNLRLSRNVVTANEEEFRVHEDELPDSNLHHRGICGVGRNRPALPQQLNVSLDVRAECHFDDVIDAVGRLCANALHKRVVGEDDCIRARTRRDLLVAFRAATGNDSRARSMCELNRASSDRTSTALHQHGASFHRACLENCAMSGYAGDTETGPLLHGNGFWKRHSLCNGTTVYSAAVPNGRYDCAP